jgi:hypothetical protein
MTALAQGERGRHERFEVAAGPGGRDQQDPTHRTGCAPNMPQVRLTDFW